MVKAKQSQRWQKCFPAIFFLSLFLLAGNNFGQTPDKGRKIKTINLGTVNIIELEKKEKSHPEQIKKKGQEEFYEQEELFRHSAIPHGAKVIRSNIKPGKMRKEESSQSTPSVKAPGLGEGTTGSAPPDVAGAVSANYLVEVLNTGILISDKEGLQLNSVRLDDFFSSTNFSFDIFDPHILYDVPAGRWLITAAANRRSPYSGIVLAISENADPRGNWAKYFIDIDSYNGSWLDFPTLGLNNNWVAISGAAITRSGRIKAVSNAQQCQITCIQPHGLSVGAQVVFSGMIGMGELNLNAEETNIYTVTEVNNPYTFTINVNSANYGINSIPIIAATNEDFCQITTGIPHGFPDGALIYISGIQGMTELNEHNYRITVTGPNTFRLNDVHPMAEGYHNYSGGGIANPASSEWVYEPNAPLSNLFVFDKNELYNSNGAGAPSPTLFHTPGATLCPAYDCNNQSNDLSLLFDAVNALGHCRITGTPARPVLTEAQFIAVSDTWARNEKSLPQRGSSQLINGGDARLGQVVMRNGSLWCAHSVKLLSPGVPQHSAVQWWQINPTTSEVLQFGRIEDETGVMHYAYPSIDVNQSNDVLIGFSSFSQNQFGSANYAYHLHGDPTGSTAGNTIFKSGAAVYGDPFGNRWGDYSSTIADPDLFGIWTVQEYAGLNGWETEWQEVQVVCIPAPSPNIMGSVTVCPGQQYTYSISNSGGNPNYRWSPPANSSIISGQNSDHVTLSLGSNFSSGNLCAVPQCGSNPQACIVLQAPEILPPPTSIVGPSRICGKTGISVITYTLPSDMTGKYVWKVKGKGIRILIPPAPVIPDRPTDTNDFYIGRSALIEFNNSFRTGEIMVSSLNKCKINGEWRKLEVRSYPKIYCFFRNLLRR